ncbi:MAG: site-2 protease family protein, partial [Candidatus Spechtbacterales bacterium]
LISAIFMIGAPTELTSEELVASASDRAVFISFVAEGSPAFLVDLRPNDKIIALSEGGESVEPIEAPAVQEFIGERLGKEISIIVERGEERIEYSLVPRQNIPEGEGALGIALAEVGTVSYPPHIALWRAFVASVTRLGSIAQELTNVVVTLVRTGSASESVAGPVGVASMAGTIQQQGVVNYLYFLAIISLNLAVINSIPFPALDGGRFLFLLIERIKGSPVNKRYESGIHAAGFAFLMLLVVLITIRDIRNLL